MSQETALTNREFQRQILEFCKHIVGSNKVVAICQSDYDNEETTWKTSVEVLLIVKNFQPRLMSYVRFIGNRNVVFFTVDQWFFERDIDRGFLGEALGGLLVFPYVTLVNQEYLKRKEISLKMRLILELLENIILGYPEFSYHMRIDPEYFMYEIILNQVRVFPPMAYGTAQFLRGTTSLEKINSVKNGYMKALAQLQKEGIIGYFGKYITISKKFIEESKNPKIRFTNTIKRAPRALFTSFFRVFPQLLNFLAQNSEAFLRFQTISWKRDFDSSRIFVNPQKYIFVPTSEGYVSLADKINIQEYAEKILKDRKYSKIEVEEFGGFLNDVYLIKAYTDHSERRILAKRFKDLSSMKWFPLSMWSIGARSFALMGKSRLERECAINDVLTTAGFCVPKILHVSAAERIVFMEFIEGEDFSHVIKRIALTQNNQSTTKEMALVSKVGEIYAKVHALNVVLGDTKPENLMVGYQNNLCLIDFEQASHNGDKSWDIACFLYYCGHYLPLNGEQKAGTITEAFINGYLSANGSIDAIKCAGNTKYVRVFSIFTLPGILRLMAKTCKNVNNPNKQVTIH